MPPAVTAACGVDSAKRSSISVATTLRGRPRTMARADTHIRRSPLASHRHGAAHVYACPVVRLVPDCAALAEAVVKAVASGPPLSRTTVVHVVLARVSTLSAFCWTCAALGHPAAAAAEVQLAGADLPIVPGQLCASWKPWAYSTPSARF